MDLSKKKCITCEGGMPPMSYSLIKKYLKQVKNWKLKNKHLYKEFKFNNFKETLKFVNKIGKVAERKGHHPNIYFTYGKCNIEIWTHSVNGLSINDFILAANIDKIKA
ncbi:MAG: 4a-hydroxytetrahydrobiopterin dehydratase [Nanoarchaeota archaeon]